MKYITQGVLPFTDKNHLKNHLNYLFRTDKKQQWTNEYTKNNVLFIFDEDNKLNAYKLDGDFEDRKDYKEQILEQLEKMDLSRLRMVRLEWVADVWSFNKEMIDEMIDTMILLNQMFHVLLFITHEDQLKNYVHFHAIFSI